jgi:hypothetical protein
LIVYSSYGALAEGLATGKSTVFQDIRNLNLKKKESTNLNQIKIMKTKSCPVEAPRRLYKVGALVTAN